MEIRITGAQRIMDEAHRRRAAQNWRIEEDDNQKEGEMIAAEIERVERSS